MKVYVRTPSRLHFSLIDMNGQLGRIDGSLGLALDYPNVVIQASKSEEITVRGGKDASVEKLASVFLRHFKIRSGAQIEVKSTIPKHVGLGSKTQLSLAVASVLSKIYGIKKTTRELAIVMKRGGTSGIGVAAFEKGGLILDGGHSFGRGGEKKSFLPSSASKAHPAPVLVRYTFPEDWFFVIAIPHIHRGVHGEEEISVFKERCPVNADCVGKACRIILMKLLPALLERNIENFGSGLTELQDAGFASATRDLVHPVVRRCIQFMLKKGAYGAGQSSFGPSTFGLVQGEDEAEKLRDFVADFLEETVGGDAFYTSANNRGATIKIV
mgnify:CR=1 FL=1